MNEQENSPAGPGEPDATQRLGRRRFWRGLLGEMMVAAEEMRGIGHRSLRELAGLPDAILAEIIPVWRQGVSLEIREEGIYRIAPGAEAAWVYSFHPHERMMVEQYGCGRNLQTIAGHVAQAAGLDQERAFAATRALFLRLCQRGWCHPAACHLPPRGDTT